MPQLVSMGGFGLLLFMLFLVVWAFWKRKVITPETFAEMKESRDLERKRADLEADLRRKAEDRADGFMTLGEMLLSILRSIEEKASRREER